MSVYLGISQVKPVTRVESLSRLTPGTLVEVGVLESGRPEPIINFIRMSKGF